MISTFRKLHIAEAMEFPKFRGTRIMMMPVVLGDTRGVPEQYEGFVAKLYGMTEMRHQGEIGYLTISEKFLATGETLRRPGLHVDGYFEGKCGGWGGGGGGWGSVGNGMLTVSNTPHCRAYLGEFEGEPGPDGECDHIRVKGGLTFESFRVYWVDGACIHQSMPVAEETARQFVRLSMPSSGPWFEGYTVNPCGVLPSADVLPRRSQMDWRKPGEVS